VANPSPPLSPHYGAFLTWFPRLLPPGPQLVSNLLSASQLSHAYPSCPTGEVPPQAGGVPDAWTT